MASPVTFMRRTVTRPLTLSGHDFAEGDKLVLFYGAANRDPRVFDDPERFDVRRDPNPHVGFGGPGPALLPRRPPGPPRAVGGLPPAVHPAARHRGVRASRSTCEAAGIPLVGGIKHLPVRFTPTAPSSTR